MELVTFDLCEGNPGALTFMMAAYDKHLCFAERAFARMRDNGIKGAMLYMLWNDCCDRDISKAVDIMINEPIDSIAEHINYERGRGIPYSGYVCKVIKEAQNET